jgi:GTP diphosphokinase / guanosine-3',5'-bis(diphosphate) 3'-diphosphatase
MSRKEFFQELAHKHQHSDWGLKKIYTAYWFSKNVHRPQKRDNGERYFEHPLRVAKTLIDIGYDDVTTISTALLHDVVEDTFSPESVIVDLFGPEIWSNISVLSKTRMVLDPISFELVVKAKQDTNLYFMNLTTANKTARLVKLSDRLDNITDLDTFTPQRRTKYIKETIDFILPIARNTEPLLEKKITDIISKFQ